MKSVNKLVFNAGSNLWVWTGTDGLDQLVEGIDAEAAFELIQNNKHNKELKGSDETIYIFELPAIFPR